jgi:hypothetical protein
MRHGCIAATAVRKRAAKPPLLGLAALMALEEPQILGCGATIAPLHQLKFDALPFL